MPWQNIKKVFSRILELSLCNVLGLWGPRRSMHDVSILEHAKQACAYCKNSKIDFIKFTEKKPKQKPNEQLCCVLL